MADGDSTGVICLGVGVDEHEALAVAFRGYPNRGDISRLPQPVVILPARSGIGDGPLANALGTTLSAHGVITAVVEPPRLLNPRSHTDWRRIPMTRPDTRLRVVRLPATVVDAASRVSITTVDTQRPAPIALDALVRYAHPRLRLLIRAAREQAALAVEINLAARPDLLVTAGRIAAWHVVGVTGDLVAAELFGLAFREDPVLASLELANPWEDPLVQRATELDLGVALPSRLRLHAPEPLPDAVATTLDRICLRLGMTAPSR